MADADPAVAEKVEEAASPQVVTEGEASPKPEAAKEPEIDWAIEGPKEKAERVKERDARLKVEADFQSFKRGRLVAEEREAALEATRSLAEETRDIARATLASQKRALEAAGDKEGLAALEKQEQEISAKRGKQTLEETHQVALTKIETVGKKLGLDLKAMNEDAHFETARSLFTSGRYAEAVVEIYETRDRILAERAEQEKAKEAEAPKPKAEPKRTMTDIGRGSGGQGPRVTNENIDTLWLKFDREHPNEPNPYSNQYREVLKR